ncbi:GpE family phage tail protein [Actinobacillus seminis]
MVDHVEDAIADIAMVFHWQPDAFDNMSFSDLISWREKARERSEVNE